MPGLGSTTGVAILIPLTFTLEPVTALIMLAGIYYGAQYGGTITSVLISTPGEAASVVTTLDGYQMARRVAPVRPWRSAAIGSFIAAIISLALLMALAPPLAMLALNFGPVENLAIMILGLVIVVSFAGGPSSKGAHDGRRRAAHLHRRHRVRVQRRRGSRSATSTCSAASRSLKS